MFEAIGIETFGIFEARTPAMQLVRSARTLAVMFAGEPASLHYPVFSGELPVPASIFLLSDAQSEEKQLHCLLCNALYCMLQRRCSSALVVGNATARSASFGHFMAR